MFRKSLISQFVIGRNDHMIGAGNSVEVLSTPGIWFYDRHRYTIEQKQLTALTLRKIRSHRQPSNCVRAVQQIYCSTADFVAPIWFASKDKPVSRGETKRQYGLCFKFWSIRSKATAALKSICSKARTVVGLLYLVIKSSLLSTCRVTTSKASSVNCAGALGLRRTNRGHEPQCAVTNFESKKHLELPIFRS